MSKRSNNRVVGAGSSSGMPRHEGTAIAGIFGMMDPSVQAGFKAKLANSGAPQGIKDYFGSLGQPPQDQQAQQTQQPPSSPMAADGNGDLLGMLTNMFGPNQRWRDIAAQLRNGG